MYLLLFYPYYPFILYYFRKELNETPLMTQQMREMEESAKVLSALNQYPVTQLRIYFPDNYVIQASFKPIDTISSVQDFVRPLLANPASEFSLCMYGWKGIFLCSIFRFHLCWVIVEHKEKISVRSFIEYTQYIWYHCLW